MYALLGVAIPHYLLSLNGFNESVSLTDLIYKMFLYSVR